MTEREQVIAELLYLKHDCLEGSSTDQTIDIAIALLKAQEPVKPTIGGDADGPCRNWWYQCGKCKEVVGYHDKYCKSCGQAVKWELDSAT